MVQCVIFFSWKSSILRVWKVSSLAWSWSRSRLCSLCWFFPLCVYFHAHFPNLRILAFLTTCALCPKTPSWCCRLAFCHCYRAGSLAVFIRLSSRQAGVNIQRCMYGLLCMTVFWRSFGSFFQVLFRTIAICYSRLYFYSGFYYFENILDTG